jgi:hypothetical protein
MMIREGEVRKSRSRATTFINYSGVGIGRSAFVYLHTHRHRGPIQVLVHLYAECTALRPTYPA